LKTIVILDGQTSAGLAFIRSLGRAGYRIIVGVNSQSFAPSLSSRYCHGSFRYPNPMENTNAFIDHIKGEAERLQCDLIVPITGATIWPLILFSGEFTSFTKLAVPVKGAVDVVDDKYATLSLAGEIGIKTPDTILVKNINNLNVLSDFDYPVVIKDRFSIRWENNKGIPGTVRYAYSKEELMNIVGSILGYVGDLLVQKFTGGVGIGFSCFTIDGNVYLPFQWKRLRETDPRGSGSSARLSIDLDHEIVEKSKELILRTGYQGISMVEFKQDKKTKEYCLMEINGRPWGSIQLPIHCGIDYPLHFINWIFYNRKPPMEIPYKKRINCRWLTADLVHLENLWNGKPTGWPYDYPIFLINFLKVCIPWYPGLRYDDFSLYDPVPGVVGLKDWIKRHV